MTVIEKLASLDFDLGALGAESADNVRKAAEEAASNLKHEADVGKEARRLLNLRAMEEIPLKRQAAIGGGIAGQLMSTLSAGHIGRSKGLSNQDVSKTDTAISVGGGVLAGGLSGFMMPSKPRDIDGLITSLPVGKRGGIYGGLLGGGLSLGSLFLGKALGDRQRVKDQANLPIYKREGGLNLGSSAVPLAALSGAGIGAALMQKYQNRPLEATQNVRIR